MEPDMTVQSQAAVFLDRDGVINHDTGYAYRPDQCIFIDGVFAAIARINAAGYLVIVVTNQSGVARGLYSEEDVMRFHVWMQAECAMQGARIDAFYYAPTHPEGQIARYCMEHEDRKPGAGMILRAAVEHDIDLSRSFLIGDKPTDLEAARRANIPGFYFSGGNLDDCVRDIFAGQQI